ncbi:hypothetical protein [Nostoc sp.]
MAGWTMLVDNLFSDRDRPHTIIKSYLGKCVNVAIAFGCPLK